MASGSTVRAEYKVAYVHYCTLGVIQDWCSDNLYAELLENFNQLHSTLKLIFLSIRPIDSRTSFTHWSIKQPDVWKWHLK